jgi:hypothetical protein
MPKTRPAFAELMKRIPIYPNPKTNVGRMLVTKAVVHVPDLAVQSAYTEQREPGIVAAVEIGHVRTFLAVPMLREGELIGAILLARELCRNADRAHRACDRATVNLAIAKRGRCEAQYWSCLTGLRSTSQVASAAMSFRHILSNGPRSSSAMVMI